MYILWYDSGLGVKYQQRFNLGRLDRLTQRGIKYALSPIALPGYWCITCNHDRCTCDTTFQQCSGDTGHGPAHGDSSSGSEIGAVSAERPGLSGPVRSVIQLGGATEDIPTPEEIYDTQHGNVLANNTNGLDSWINWNR